MKMQEDKIFSKLVKKQVEISNLPLQEVYVFTSFYKKIVPYLKVRPWRVMIVIAFLMSLMFRLIFGHSFIKLTSILQAGF